MCGSAVAALGANQGPWEPTMVPGSQPMPLKATHGPWDPTKAPFFSQDGNLRHFPPFWTTILDYALGYIPKNVIKNKTKKWQCEMKRLLYFWQFLYSLFAVWDPKGGCRCQYAWWTCCSRNLHCGEHLLQHLTFSYPRFPADMTDWLWHTTMTL